MSSFIPPWEMTPDQRRDAERRMKLPEGHLDGQRFQRPASVAEKPEKR